MAGMVVVAVEGVALGGGAVADDHFHWGAHFHVHGGVGAVLSRDGVEDESCLSSIRHGRSGCHGETEGGVASSGNSTEAGVAVVDRDAWRGAAHGGCPIRGGSAAVVVKRHGDGHGFTRVEASVVVTGGIADRHVAKGQGGCVDGLGEVVSPGVVAAHGHGDGEIGHGAVGDVVGDRDRVGIVCQNGSPGCQAADAVAVVSDGDAAGGAAQYRANVGGGIHAHVFESDIEVAAFVVFRNVVIGIVISDLVHRHEGALRRYDRYIGNRGDPVLSGKHQFGCSD
ncbi:MAG: hypothetical protein BWX75_01409 [Candidatus Cloacimonetes bacterium ADurb.Bin088]|nr:MAG: hypothetical protein BWX75_01409 [Candidatus Cloacimonetes bacterium ADurb.Bin088]